MSPIFSILAILMIGFLIMAILKKQAQRRRQKPDGAGFLEYRTPLAFDECLDKLDAPSPEDEFQYSCRRQPDGMFLLNLTLHQPTNQPMDTLFSFRMDSGKETVITLCFIREAFGYDRPVFPQEMLDKFLSEKLSARRTR